MTTNNPNLSAEQLQLCQQLESTRDHLFITGKAGTGKSVLLQTFKQTTTKNCVTLAPTGIAALNVGGQTIHSFFKLPLEVITPEKKLRLTHHLTTVLNHLDAIIIDEISMVRADIIDAIDQLLRRARGVSIPFGGIQMIMFGDPYQLPPVIQQPAVQEYFTDNYGGNFFFHAHVWQSTQFTTHELITIFRQQDPQFISILNHIRTGTVTAQHLHQLNHRVVDHTPPDEFITLVPTNNLVTLINHRQLANLNNPVSTYQADVSGDLEQSTFPTDRNLQLKVGAQVMFVKNDRERRWVNGTLGHIESLTTDQITVSIDGQSHQVTRETWNKIGYFYNPETKKIDEYTLSSFTQFPLRLAWAITIHKSQGQTYPVVAIDMGRGAFAHGQTYVALSRCQSLEGLYLKRAIIPQDIRVNPQILSFMNNQLDKANPSSSIS